MNRPSRFVSLGLALVLSTVGAGALSLTQSVVDAGKRVEASRGMVTSANALASEAGVAMLRAGGNAVDAAVATAFAIGVVEPQMSGLGGSGAALVWTASEARPSYLDFYAAQPADAWRGHAEPEPAATPGQPVAPGPPPAAGREPGDLRIVGVPGAVAGLLALHARFGTLSREQVMAPAIRLAEDGFPVGKVLADFIASGEQKMKPFPAAVALFFPDGRPLPPGAILRNAELAASLRRVSAEGRHGFDAGLTAKAIVAVLNAGRHPATTGDLARYEPQWKRPLCTDYRGFTVLSAPPPQTGLQVLHTLELLEPFHLKTLGLPMRSAEAFDVMASALRVGQTAVRTNADPNWVAVPAAGTASAEFAATRRLLVGQRSAPPSIEPADPTPFDSVGPPGDCPLFDPYGPAVPISGPSQPLVEALDGRGAWSADATGETTHVSVVDASGNAVAITLTNSSVWGAGGFAAGFFLNDSGFRFTDRSIEAPSRSRWRIRTTTIAPTVVLKDGEVQLVIGAPGGGRIPTEIAQVMVYVLDHGLDPLDAVRLPRMFPSAANPRVQIEHGFTPQVLADVRAMGYDPVAESSGYARLYLIVRRAGVWVGVADPRHDGEPRGY